MSNAETIIKEGFNKVSVQGLVKEKRFEIKKAGTPDEILIGEIDIEKEEDSVHTFKIIAKRLKRDGNPNKIFESAMTISNDYKSIADVGREEADKVKITTGALEKNEYWGQDGQFKSYSSMRTPFVNRLRANETYEPQAKFEVDVVVSKMVEEIKNDEETGRVIIHAYIVLYGGRVIEETFVVSGEQKVNYVMDNYTKGSSVKLMGEIINSATSRTITKEVDFGEPREEIIETTVREYVVTGGTAPKEEGEAGYVDPALLTKALQERENRLQEMKEKQAQRQSSNSGSGSSDMAFGGTPATPPSNKQLDEMEELPF